MTGVAFFVYRRPDLTKKVIDSIKKNNFSKIYIFQDGLTDSINRESWEKVGEMIKEIESPIIEVHISDCHKGLAKSVIEGMNYVFERHDTAIAIEDDMLLADDYSEYMEKSFERYSTEDRVMSVAGTSFGILTPKNYKYDVFFSYRMSSAGFGTWRKYWKEFVNDYYGNPFILKDIYANNETKKIMNIIGSDVERILHCALRGEVDSWALYWTLFQVSKKGLTVIPSVGYAKDIGHQGDGTNSVNYTRRYDSDFLVKHNDDIKFPETIVIDENIIKDAYIVISTMDDVNRFKSYYPLLYSWVKKKQNNEIILSYFIRRGINNIYIYGKGKISELLVGEINDEINICGYIEEEKREGLASLIAIDDKSIDEDIPIVITPIYDKDYILHLIEKYNISNRIIWINELFEENYEK